MQHCQDNGISLTSLSLTHVQFDPQDKVAYALAYITLLPLAILVFYGSVILARREIAGILMLLGQLLNEGFNAILKESLQISRPHAHLGKGYGMPSSHAQFIWYFAVYGTIYLWTCIRIENDVFKALLSIALLIVAALVSYSRIYLGYHSLPQIIVGSAVGSAFAIVWFRLVERRLRQTGLIDRLLDLPISKRLYLRDMRFIDNVARWEYTQWQQERVKVLQRETNSEEKTK